MLKTTINKKKEHNKVVILARSKLNSIESKKSVALINSQISHQDFMTIVNEEKNTENSKKALAWWRVKGVILKKNNLIGEGEKIGNGEVIKHNEIINKRLKSHI